MDIVLHTNKSRALLVLVAVFVSTANTGTEAKPLQVSKPNIIIIMPDDSGYGNHSCFNNLPVINTPNIDALKKESLLLTRYHSSARCSPSRAKLLSGRHEFLGGVTHIPSKETQAAQTWIRSRYRKPSKQPGMPRVCLASGTMATKGLTVPRIAVLMKAGFTKRAQNESHHFSQWKSAENGWHLSY